MNLPGAAEDHPEGEPPQVPNDRHPDDDAMLPDVQDQLGEEFPDEDEEGPAQDATTEDGPKKRIFISEAMYYRYLYRYVDPTNAAVDLEELRRKSTL